MKLYAVKPSRPTKQPPTMFNVYKDALCIYNMIDRDKIKDLFEGADWQETVTRVYTSGHRLVVVTPRYLRHKQ